MASSSQRNTKRSSQKTRQKTRSYNQTTNYVKYKSNPTYAKQLASAESSQPTYKDNYASYKNSLVNNLENAKFEFDAGNNQMYQDYVNDYRLLGHVAAAQAEGMADELSGGYGTTYGQTVAQQGLDNYLANEKAILPSLYEAERNSFAQDQANMVNKGNLYNQLEGQDFNQFLTRLDAWNKNREYAYNKWYNDYMANAKEVNKSKGWQKDYESSRARTAENGTQTSVSNVGGSGRTRRSTKAKYSKLNSKAISSRDGAMAYLANNGLDASNVISKEQFAAENASRGWNAYNGALYEEGEKGYSGKNKKQLDKDYQDYLLNYIRQAQGLDDTDWFTKKQKKLGYSNKKH